MKKIFLLLSLLLLVGCTEPDAATNVLRDQGYRDITITGYRPFMKSDDDTFSTGFEATSPNGTRVHGAVTGGGLKGHTIRFD